MDKESPEYIVTLGMVLGVVLCIIIFGTSEDYGSPYARSQSVSPERIVIIPGETKVDITNLSGVEYVYKKNKTAEEKFCELYTM